MGRRQSNYRLEALELRMMLALASDAELLRDLSPGGLNDSDLVVANDQLFFSVSDDLAGRELWASDGTAAGTRRVRDIRKGREGASVQNLVAFDGAVYFSADDGKRPSEWGAELWRSDGTDAGTYKVPVFSNDGSRPSDLRVIGGRLYFHAPVGAQVRFKDEHIRIDPGGGAPVRTKLTQMFDATGVGPRVFYTDANYLYVYTPASSAARAVKELRALEVAEVDGGRAVVAARQKDDATGLELWTSDATAAGTRLLKDIRPGGEGSDVEHLTSHRGVAYFAANDGAHGVELWRSDGTARGTYLLKDIRAGAGDSFPSEFRSAGSNLFFTADDGAGGFELWRTDGTSAGTVRLRDIRPGIAGSAPDYLRDVNGVLYFSADDGAGGREPWRSDGTPAGTVRVADIRPGPLGSNPTNFVRYRGATYVSVASAGHGYQLWRTDGTPRGTSRVTTFAGRLSNASNPFDLRDVNGVVYFSARNGSRTIRWRSDGTRAGTLPLNAAPAVRAAGASGEVTYNWDTWALWRSDGTDAGTVRLTPRFDGTLGPEPTTMIGLGERALFTWDHEIWTSDGSTAGTRLAVSVPDVRFTEAYASGEVALFAAATSRHEGRLYRTDGTRQGTVLLKSFGQADSLARVHRFTPGPNGLTYFVAKGELWRTDGTPDGTIPLAPIPSVTSSSPMALATAGDVLYFLYGDRQRMLLGRSDGTPAGTNATVKDLGPGRAEPELVALGRHVFFAGDNGTHGVELWRSDGTAPGTVMLKDIYRGGKSAQPKELTTVGRRVYFSAYHIGTGWEIYETDGSSGGTRLVRDINPGPADSSPTDLTASGGRLFFTAAHPTHAREMWKVDPPATISGVLFHDADRDRRLDAGEQRLAGFRVFSDRNANGKFDSGELFARTDDRGEYVLEVEAGLHRITVTPVAGYSPTTVATVNVRAQPAGTVRKHFGQFRIG